MGKPAARLGDMTIHGGNITVGCPTVLIGGQPAARMGDMHVCPMQTPAPVPVPHVGGPIAISSAPTVLIGGQPAACVGDMATCVGPPDSIAPPGCPTVLIGAGGGGGGGGAGAGGAQAKGAPGGAAAAAANKSAGASGTADEAEAESENHYLDVKFKDKGGKPITGVAYKVSSPGKQIDRGGLYGGVKKSGVEAGDHKIELRGITKVEWSKKEARVGDKVKLIAETVGIESGTKAIFEIWQQNINQPPKQIKTIRDAEVSGGKIEVEWTYEYEDQPGDEAPSKPTRKLSSPQYFFIVKARGSEAKSAMLQYRDWIEIKLKDDEGNPVANEEYVLRLSNGTIRKGNLDGSGYKKEENVPPGEFAVSFPKLSHVGPDDEANDSD